MLHGQMLAAVGALAMISGSGGACAMTRPASGPVTCRVSGADKALADAGGPAALCQMIERAAKARDPAVSFAVHVHAPSTHSLAAKIELPDGRVLPELKMAVSDRSIDQGSVEQFAAAISDAAANAIRQ